MKSLILHYFLFVFYWLLAIDLLKEQPLKWKKCYKWLNERANGYNKKLPFNVTIKTPKMQRDLFWFCVQTDRKLLLFKL